MLAKNEGFIRSVTIRLSIKLIVIARSPLCDFYSIDINNRMYKQKQLCNIAELPYFQYVKDMFWVPYGHNIDVLTHPVNLPEEN